MSNSIATLRRKISVAHELQSVVRTMKSVAASNIGQYENSVRALVDYNRTVELGLRVCLGHPQRKMGREKQAAMVGAIVFGSDQGLIGPFNEIVANFAIKHLEGVSQSAVPAPQTKAKVWVVGERVHLQFENSGTPIAGVFNLPSYVNTITPLVDDLTTQVLSKINAEGGNDSPGELFLFYNHPGSGSAYEPKAVQLLPLDQKWRNDLAKVRWPTRTLPEIICEQDSDQYPATERDRSQNLVLRAFIQEYIFVSIFRACAESLASENASRLSAMQRADKNIEDLLTNLNGTFHRTRQSEIDEELFDVVASFEILSKTKKPFK